MSIMENHTIQNTRTHWQYLVDQQAQSNLSGAAFCREHGIKYASFMGWRKRLSNAEADSATTSSFVELIAPTGVNKTVPSQPSEYRSNSPVCIELSLGDGIELRITRHQ